MTSQELKDIRELLKSLKFERSLHQDGSYSYYKFNNKKLFQFYLDDETKKFTLYVQGDKYPTVRATDEMVLQVILVEFADKKDLIREWKLKKLGI